MFTKTNPWQLMWTSKFYMEIKISCGHQKDMDIKISSVAAILGPGCGHPKFTIGRPSYHFHPSSIAGHTFFFKLFLRNHFPKDEETALEMPRTPQNTCLEYCHSTKSHVSSIE